ncbi:MULTISPECIES: glycosyltransferase family 2 protein [Olivibacter]|jgi:glycosyltransferase involved in cell wall biosynthesis|uniref:Glycosyltransferase family 2 protein n=1 Tax=Olivibacter oleidegradans TaxID=760123 RepID=A0ABV6HGV2_9SPHI|nr:MULTISPECIES: glycosyltransferase family 2 protein [Olivibacter]MDM8176746.1 glycosyltransferase family 2 protein [Olivibacter sp. 47]QEL00564.1 glycosyltransferase family 2 protein [Olivibacter sp. LS-1]
MVSVIIPCFNCEGYLSRAVESVLNQKYKDWEIVFVNNNSSDGSQKIIEKYVKQFPERMCSVYEYKKGAGFARNTGLNLAKGEWIQFLDADDEILPDKLLDQLEIGVDADVVIGSFTRVYRTKMRPCNFKVVSGDSIWRSLFFSRAGITSANLYRKHSLLAIDGWNTTISSSQEYDLMFRLLKNNVSIKMSEKICAIIYEEQNSVSRPSDLKKRQKIGENYVELRVRIAEHLNAIGGWDKKLRKDFAVSIYNMLLGLRGASVSSASTKMRSLNLTVPIQYKVPLILKHYIKRFIIRSI